MFVKYHRKYCDKFIPGITLSSSDIIYFNKYLTDSKLFIGGDRISVSYDKENNLLKIDRDDKGYKISEYKSMTCIKGLSKIMPTGIYYQTETNNIFKKY